MSCNVEIGVAGCQAVSPARCPRSDGRSRGRHTRGGAVYHSHRHDRSTASARPNRRRHLHHGPRMRTRTISLTVAALALGTTLAFAEPELLVRYPDGVPQISITGQYPGAVYSVYRAPAGGGPFERISENAILCLGSCYAEDRTAVPGETYRYRFDLMVSNAETAGFVVYGPFLATISPALARSVGVFVFPNPGRGIASVQLHLGGAAGARALHAQAAIYDLGGRRRRVIHR